MQELPLALLRFGILALLWFFVLVALRVIRSDLADRPAPVTPQLTTSPRRQQPPPAQPAAWRSAAGTLVVTSGPLAGTTLALDNAPITFGRAENCTLVLDDDYVSSQHARLTPAGDRWLLEDLGSTNGTYLSERKISDPTPVPLGAPIRLGRTVLELRR
ncbi:MAG: FHA domain-containing protein [Frankiaceae bacterium]